MGPGCAEKSPGELLLAWPVPVPTGRNSPGLAGAPGRWGVLEKGSAEVGERASWRRVHGGGASQRRGTGRGRREGASRRRGGT